jgi:hydroxypyruvate isomerase
MKRRNFMQSSLMAGASLLAAGAANAAGETRKEESGKTGQPFHLNYAIHHGMFQNHAGDDFVDQIKFAYDAGFRSIEDNGMTGRPEAEQSKIGDALAKLGLTMGVFVLNKGGNGENTLASGRKEHIEIFLKGCRQAVEVSKRINGKLTTMVPGDFDRNLPMGIQTANVIQALRRGAEILEPHNIVMVLEPLSDTPDLFLRTADQTYAICKAVNSPSCKILYDMYHMQRNSGDIIKNLDYCYDEIAYYQIGDNPGRKEPTTGEVNYKNIFKHLYHKGYKGMLGMEHGIALPGKEGELALIKAYRDSDDFA